MGSQVHDRIIGQIQLLEVALRGPGSKEHGGVEVTEGGADLRNLGPRKWERPQVAQTPQG